MSNTTGPWAGTATPRTPVTPAPPSATAAPSPQAAPRTRTSWVDLAALIGPITWHWERWLAPGFVHLVASKSGLGKSTLAMRIAACYLRGDPWPDGAPFDGNGLAVCRQGCVLWLETENAQALNLSRAMQWGLPADRVLNPFADPLAELALADRRHRKAVEDAAKDPDVALVVLDSLSGAWAGRDENDAKVLELMKWLAGVARDSDKPVLVTHHLRKGTQEDPKGEVTLDMLRGSSAVVQVARLVWALDRPSKTDTTLRLQVLKSNLARFPGPLAMAIDDAGAVTFGGQAPQRNLTDQDEAEAFLRGLLAQGPVAASDVYKQARAVNISDRTLERAKDALGADSYRQGQYGTGCCR